MTKNWTMSKEEEAAINARQRRRDRIFAHLRTKNTYAKQPHEQRRLMLPARSANYHGMLWE